MLSVAVHATTGDQLPNGRRGWHDGLAELL